MLIKTNPSHYFFSGDLNLEPNTEKDINLNNLTEIQLSDIIEGIQTQDLIKGDVGEILRVLRNKTTNSGDTPIEGPTTAPIISAQTKTYVTKEEFEAIKESQDPSLEYIITDGYAAILTGEVEWLG